MRDKAFSKLQESLAKYGKAHLIFTPKREKLCKIMSYVSKSMNILSVITRYYCDTS